MPCRAGGRVAPSFTLRMFSSQQHALRQYARHAADFITRLRHADTPRLPLDTSLFIALPTLSMLATLMF